MRRLFLNLPQPLLIMLVGLVTAGNVGTTRAGEFVQIVHGQDAPALEVYAANELADLLQRAFTDVTTQVGDQATRRSAVTLCVGSPQTNELTRKYFPNWPKVSDQGIVIRSLDGGPVYAVGGGSPAATLWAVYELGHRIGFRYLPRGDIDPIEKKASIDLSRYDTVLEPQLRSRTFRTINDLAIGPASWGVDEHKRLLKQLAKLKYNRLMLSVSPWQPYVEYEFGGIKKTTALHWYGEEFPVDGETVGKKVFRGSKVFENPDFVGLATPAERHAAGRDYLQQLIGAAHDLGMTVGVSISPLEFPREFQTVLPGSQVVRQSNGLTVTAGAEHPPTDVRLLKLAATKVRAYLETYPELDELILTLPESPEWHQHAKEALRLLKKRGVSPELTVEQLIKQARDRRLTINGQRGERAIKSQLVVLAFLGELLSDSSLLKRKDGEQVELVIGAVDPALYPVLNQVLPDRASALNVIDKTARRVANHRELLASVPAKTVPSRLVMTLADDNAGVLPQSALQSLEVLADGIKKQGWDGYSTRYLMPGEFDSSVYFLSRASWTKDLTAKASFKDLWSTATLNDAAADRLWIAWQHLEKATNLIDENDTGFSFPVDGLLMKHYRAEPLPDWWEQATESYTQYMIELYRAHGAISGDAKPMLFYYAKRAEYVLEYLAAVKAVREAALAKKAGDHEAALEQLEVALESAYNCINTLSDVARDQSDRGLIAVLNKFAFRPLLAEVEKLGESVD